MGQIFHSDLSPQEKLHRSRELLRWAERMLKQNNLTARVSKRAKSVVTLAKKSIRIRRVAMRASIRAVK